MRTFALAVVVALALVSALSRPAKASPDPTPAGRGIAATEVRGGFSKRFVAGTVAATLPKAAAATTVAAGIKVTVEIGAD